MQQLPNIKLSKQELTRLMASSLFSRGGEAMICKPSARNTLYKIFIQGKTVIGMNENKERKIVKLHNLALKHSVQPLSTISCNGQLIGYEMSYDPHDIKAYPGIFKRETRIYFLKECAKILQYFATKDIVYGDVAYRNILLNPETGKFKFCDMDNIQIGEHPIDLIGTIGDLATYEQCRGIDSKTDAYMHNIMTLSTLGIDFPYCYEDDINAEFRNPTSQIVDSMKEPEDFNGEYIIQYVKKKR